ncbi:MAG: ATP-binding protein [Campylobacterota bacterium]|nr:ATP-binding protein [Campylobacterota bacterium]
MQTLDFSQSILIAPKIYWIGMYLENDPFQCHPYLIENGNESILVDPGSMLEFDAVVKKVNSITNLGNIKYIILHHQDPDLCASVPDLEKLINRDDLQIITHSRMTPLIKHYLTTSSYYEIDKHELELITQNGYTLEFLTTPYCHSPGAFVSYDPASSVLFSGDIFGGIDESWEFFAKDDYFEKAKQFHAEYMPSKDIFNYALKKIEALNLELIAPQHGSIIQKPYISGLIAQMKNLDCGLYIEEKYNSELLNTIEELKAKDLALKERETLLFQQSKMAAMGEMIGNIAHQWRQPLAIVNTLIAISKEKNNYDMLEKDDLTCKLAEMEKNIAYMSSTIEDFMDFFKPNKEKRPFSVRKAVTQALEVLYPSIKKYGVEIRVNGDHSLVVNGYINEYIQAVISILSNAKDALIENDVTTPCITIDFFINESRAILEISDNAGGIDSKIIDRIFEPYFTTKHQSIGTGLGLYIAKMIIEGSMDGSIEAKNIENGAKFCIGVALA